MSAHASSSVNLEIDGRAYRVWGYRPAGSATWVIDSITVFFWATDRFGLPVKRDRRIWNGFGVPSRHVRRIMETAALELARRHEKAA